MTAPTHPGSGPAVARGGALALAAAALLAIGCAATNPYPSATWERASFDLRRGHDREAVATIEQFLRRSPTDSLAPLAQKRKGETLMKLKEYPLAAVEMQILRQEYPNCEYVAESWFLEGEALLAQAGRLERDISTAIEARDRFRRLLTDFPNDVRAADARDRLARISDLILRKKLGESEVYVQLDQPAAACVVLEAVLAQEKEGSLRPKLIARCASLARKAHKPQDAARNWQRLVTEYPDSPEAAVARRELAKLPDKGP